MRKLIIIALCFSLIGCTPHRHGDGDDGNTDYLRCELIYSPYMCPR